MRKRALIHCIGETEGIVFLEGSGESCHTLDSGIWPQKANEGLCLSVLTLCHLGSIVVHAISEHECGLRWAKGEGQTTCSSPPADAPKSAPVIVMGERPDAAAFAG